MRVRTANATDIADWAALRAELWPSQALRAHQIEVIAALASVGGRAVALVAEEDPGGATGFVEASLRYEYVNGCETSPVAFVEGLYVRPNHRAAGIGRALLAAVETWARERGCSELASDALLENGASHAFHAAVGFHETERVVFFRKLL